jgi:predicted nucleotidyltransferase component of viral defense system
MIIPNTHLKHLETKNKRLNQVMIKKDLILSYILQDIALSKIKLIFKGGTCLSKCYLNYHRLSEDLDFTLQIGELSKKKKRSYIKNNILPLLTEIASKYSFDFDAKEFETSGVRYCPVKKSDSLFKFLIYSDKKDNYPIKIEISIKETLQTEPVYIEIKNLTDSKDLVFPLVKTKILAYTLEEIIYEKVRAILTRDKIQERDIFDLYKIDSLLSIRSVNIKGFLNKLINFDKFLIKQRLLELEKFELFEEIETLALEDIDEDSYFEFFGVLKKLIFEIVDELLVVTFK